MLVLVYRTQAVEGQESVESLWHWDDIIDYLERMPKQAQVKLHYPKNDRDGLLGERLSVLH
jgi:hypothetical protein